MITERKSGRVLSEVRILEIVDPSERYPRFGAPAADNFYYQVSSGQDGSIVVGELLLETE